MKARVTAKEAELVEAAASHAGLPTAGYVRATLLDATRRSHTIHPGSVDSQGSARSLAEDDRRLVDALRGEIHRCGVNLNQLVRLAHRGEIHSAALARSISDLAALCRSAIEELGGRAL